MKKTILLLSLLSSISIASAFQPNYDENTIGNLSLPELITPSQKEPKIFWENSRRMQVMELFHAEVYGKKWQYRDIKVIKTSPRHAIANGKGYWQLIDLEFDSQPVQLLLHMPVTNKKVPVFVGYNFCGNHSVAHYPEIDISTSWANPSVCGHKVDTTLVTTQNNKFTPESRGIRDYRWPFSHIVTQGYGVATLYYGDILPDNSDAFRAYIKEKRPNEDYGDYSAIGIWAAGLSSVIDYLVSRDDINPNNIALFGHSRLGKTALWAGATDPRARFVISNNSGEGGAALASRNYGETLGSITTDFPHWFTSKYASYANNIANLPVDQHMLMALIAPRPVYVTSAENDQWADPKGEFLSLHYAKPVYKLYTDDVFNEEQQPATGTPLHSRINYHYRKGNHDLFFYDWQQFLTVADRYMK